MTPTEEQQLKGEFIKKHPYACRGLKGATGHVSFYTEDGARQRKQIQDSWVARMSLMAEKYTEQQTRASFIDDVHELMDYMDNNYPGAFYGGMFSFARAQKSFALVLKYRWCAGLIVMPPLCPVDRRVLQRMDHPYNTWNWTEMTEEQFNHAYDRLAEIAHDDNLSVAQLELKWFGQE